VMWAIGVMGYSADIPVLLAALADPVSRVAAGALWSLGLVADGDVLSTVSALLSGPEPEIRRKALQALVRLGPEAAYPSLERGLRDDNLAVRTTAVHGLGIVGGDRAVRLLLPLLEDRQASMRWGAAWALGLAGTVDTGPLVRCLDDRALQVRGRVARSLGRLGGPGVAAALRRALDDPDPWFRSVCAGALGRIEGETPVDVVRPLVRETVEGVRRAAVSVLAAAGDRHGRTILRRGMAAPSAAVSRKWVEALAVTRDGRDELLLSVYGDSLDPWLAGDTVVDERRVRLMTRTTGLPASEVLQRYERLARTGAVRLALTSPARAPAGRPRTPWSPPPRG
jgi:HEAT repeat protein